MIFVRMSQNDGIDRDVLFNQLGKIRHVDAVAEQTLFREHHAAIDDEAMPGAFEHHQIKADLPQTAECKQF